MHRRHLPFAEPCSERFSSMEVLDGVQRHCERCQRGVFDLSSMTRVEAEYFLLQRHRRGQPTCARVEVQADQEIRFRPPPPRTAGPVLVALAGLMAACTGHLEPADLDSPEEGVMCEDVSGYTIPCLEVDDGSVSEVDPEGEEVGPSEPEVPEEVVEAEPETLEPPEWLGEPADPTREGEGCPLKRWDGEPPPDEVYELAGVMMPEYTPAEERRIEREYRAEQRRGRARRQDRRERRRQRRGGLS